MTLHFGALKDERGRENSQEHFQSFRMRNLTDRMESGAMILPALLPLAKRLRAGRSKAFPASLAGFPFISDLFFKS
jgi:hypothetical protein